MFSSPRAARKSEALLRYAILASVFALAFTMRLFSVFRFESMIHEFDPWFNFRTTKYLAEKGWHEFLNWFDGESWYPLGRIIGGTIYPGLMGTAATAYWVLRFFNIAVNIRDVCVLTAPAFSGLTAIAAYLFNSEVADEAAGVTAAFFIGIVPGYISRSVAGSYDNEGVAIFALVFTFYMFLKAVRTGRLSVALGAALSYSYMVAAWGGYIFIINIIPLYVLIMLLAGRFSYRLYTAYCTLYVLGSLLGMQIPFVGFNHVQSGEHMAALGTFGLLQIYAFLLWVRSLLTPDQFKSFVRTTIMAAGGAVALALLAAMSTGYISPWEGRFYSMLDPTYAKKHIPIIASVSEHQPTTWASYFFDLHILTFFIPAGLYYLFKDVTDTGVFLIIYGVTSAYFAGVMVRLMLVLAPAACLLGGVAVSKTLKAFFGMLKASMESNKGGDESASAAASSGPASATPVRSKNARRGRTSKAAAAQEAAQSGRDLSILVTGCLAVLMVMYAWHAVWCTSEAYSSPSIVLAARGHDGSRIFFDDFREAYMWLRMNTKPGIKIMSWWDYGYQITGMSNRTVLVDNNTWNNTHIATVGRAMASNEEVAYETMRHLDADYVLVVFGGQVGYSSDDINKFLWMIRIGGGVFHDVHEPDFYGQGQYRTDKMATKTMTDSIMYRMSYYDFGKVYSAQGVTGFDRVRNYEIGLKEYELKHLEEAFTSENWIVRIFRVKKPENRGGVLADPKIARV